MYHLAPKIFEDNIKLNGLKISNNNANYRYSESRAFVTEGDVSEKDLQELVNTLYEQAISKHIPNLTPEYSIFTFSIEEMGNEIRFFYDINEPKGLYTKVPIPPKYITSISHITAQKEEGPEIGI